MQKRINKAWDYWKGVLHGAQGGAGLQLHHIYGRVGVRRCCPMLMVMLSVKDHSDYLKLKVLRIAYLDDKQNVEANYSKETGCKTNISALCKYCPMAEVANEKI